MLSSLGALLGVEVSVLDGDDIVDPDGLVVLGLVLGLVLVPGSLVLGELCCMLDEGALWSVLCVPVVPCA